MPQLAIYASDVVVQPVLERVHEEEGVVLIVSVRVLEAPVLG
jgi:hypothetical protein